MIACRNTTLFLAAMALGGMGWQSAVARPTNLVVIMTDDQGAWSLGCYGNGEARTPAIDKLASEGVRLTQAFVATPVCSPSRATFFTGRIPSQHGIHDWIKHENVGPRARYCLPDEVTLSDMLADHGYTCGIVGKWHLGGNAEPRAGFTYWYVMPTGGSRYQDAEMIWRGERVKTEGYLTDRITDKALEFLDQHHERSFYLEVQYNAPHGPWTGHPDELVRLFDDCPFDSIPKVPTHPWASVLMNHIGKRASLQQYFAACTGIDRSVGRIMERLASFGLDDSTLVVFTSDHGFCCGHHGLWGKGNASNPRNMHEASIRTPMIFRHTGHLPEGGKVDALVSSYDFLPTLLEYLGLPPSPGRNLPGQSFAPMLRGGPVAGWPEAVYGEYGRTRMIRTRAYKYVHRSDGGPHELYDLASDPDETQNLAADPERKELRTRMRERLFAWFDRYVEAGADPVGHEYLHPSDR